MCPRLGILVLRRLARLAPWLVAAALVLSSHSLRADDAHYQTFVPGARGAMLGGAFTAIGNDSSGLYFNPAGIVDVKRAKLSISTSLYGFERQLSFASELNAQRWVDEFTSRPISGSEINIIPASTGVAWAFGRPLPNGSFPHAIAVGLVVPSYRGSLHQARYRSGPLAITSSNRISDRTILAAAGYAHRVGPWLRLGLALHAALRLVNIGDEFTIVDSSSPADHQAYLSTSSDLNITNASTALALGVKLHPSRRWLFGLTLTTPSLSVFQRGSFGVRSARANLDDGSGTATTVLEGPLFSRVRYEGSLLPFSVRVGAAYLRSNDYTLALDLSVHAPTRYQLVTDGCNVDYVSEFTPLCQLASVGRPTAFNLPGEVRRRSPIPVDVDRELTFNVNAGIEKLLRGDLSIGLGLFTDLSSAPEYQTDAAGFLTSSSTRVSNVDHLGATVSAGYFGSHSLSRLGVCGVFGLGDKARVVSPGAQVLESADLAVRPVATQEFLIYVFWSSTFRHGEGRNSLTSSEND